MNSAAEIWERVLSILKQNMTETTISTWFSDIEPVALDENRFILSVPTEFKRDILRTSSGPCTTCSPPTGTW